jgi:hypothetical protein
MPQPGSTQSDTTNAAQSIEGCLQNAGGSFVLTDTAGNKYQLQGDTPRLSVHVGHQVQITGTVTKTSASSSTESPAGGTNASSQQATIQVQDVKHIAETCSSMSK